MIAQTPWIERKFNFDFPVGIFPVIFSRLEGSIFRLQHLLQDADDAHASQQGNSWSIKQEIGHLSDLEDLWWKRLEDFQQNKEMLTAADMTNAKTNEAKHNEKTLHELLRIFSNERQKILNLVFNFDENMLSQISIHPRLQKPMRLIDSLYFVAEHDDHHIAKITWLLRQ